MMETVIWFLGSALLVDVVGYWLHRWAHRPSSPLYRPHMTHHVLRYPPRRYFSSRYRTSGSDSLALWFAPFGIVYIVLAVVLGVPHLGAVLLGGATTAILSSVVHDLSHVEGSIVWRLPFLRTMARLHRIHHSKMGRNFGVLISLWDWIFRTSYRGSAGRRSPPDPIR